MKFENDTSKFVNSDQALNGTAFHMEANAQAFRATIDSLYRYKEEAMARETISNADDAHEQRELQRASVAQMTPSHYTPITTNQNFKQIAESATERWVAPLGKGYRVHVPTDAEPYFEVEDYGIGLPLSAIIGDPVVIMETVKKEVDGYLVDVPTGKEDYQFNPNGKVAYTGGMYTTIFKSLKTFDNSQIGGFGLGCKSPATVSDSYTVTSRFNGEKHVVFMYMDETGMPMAELVTADERGFPAPVPMEEGEYNGMTVTVPINPERRQKVIAACRKVLRFMRNNYSLNRVIGVKKPEWVDYGFGNMRITVEGEGRHFVVQGGVTYPVELDQLPNSVSSKLKQIKTDTYLFVNIGTVRMQPSREDLEYVAETVDNLELEYNMAVDALGLYLRGTRVPKDIGRRIAVYNQMTKVFGATLVSEHIPRTLRFPSTSNANVIAKGCEQILGTEVEVDRGTYQVSYGKYQRIVNNRTYDSVKSINTLKQDSSSSSSMGDFYPDSNGLKTIVFVMDTANAPYVRMLQVMEQVKYLGEYKGIVPIKVEGNLMEYRKILDPVFKEEWKQECLNDLITKDKDSKFAAMAGYKQHLLNAENPENSHLNFNYGEIARSIVDAYYLKQEGRLELNDFINQVFEALGAKVVFASNVTISRRKSSALEARGVMCVTGSYSHRGRAKLKSMGEVFQDTVEKCREKGWKLPYVLLSGSDMDETDPLYEECSNLEHLASRLCNAEYFVDKYVNDETEIQVYRLGYTDSCYYGLRKNARTLLKDFDDVLVPLQDYLSELDLLTSSDSVAELYARSLRSITIEDLEIEDYVNSYISIKRYTPQLLTDDMKKLGHMAKHFAKYHRDSERESREFVNQLKYVQPYARELLEQSAAVKSASRHETRFKDFWRAHKQELDRYSLEWFNVEFHRVRRVEAMDLLETYEENFVYHMAGVKKGFISRTWKRQISDSVYARKLEKEYQTLCNKPTDRLVSIINAHCNGFQSGLDSKKVRVLPRCVILYYARVASFPEKHPDVDYTRDLLPYMTEKSQEDYFFSHRESVKQETEND